MDNAKARFLQVAQDYTLVNPHLTLTVEWDRLCIENNSEPDEDDRDEDEDEDDRDDDEDETDRDDGAAVKWTIAATNPADVQRLGRLMAAHIVHAEDQDHSCMKVREFVAEFRGLSGSAKGRRICEAVGAARLSLAEFYSDDSADRIAALLAEMRKHSRPVAAKDLGAIGKEHLAAKFLSLGAAPEAFDYKRANSSTKGALPCRVCLRILPEGPARRRIVTGINWSVSIGADPFRRLGPGGESLAAILTQQRAGADEPIVTVLQVSCPQIKYLDRGKSSVAIPGSRAW